MSVNILGPLSTDDLESVLDACDLDELTEVIRLAAKLLELKISDQRYDYERQMQDIVDDIDPKRDAIWKGKT